MKFVVPLTNLDYYDNLAEAGAGEFFCGFVPYEWLETYSAILPLNRREWFIGGYNSHSIDSMQILRKKVEQYGVNVNFTFNGKYFIEEQYPVIVEIMKRLMDAGFRSFIITDPGLLVYLRDKGISCHIHLSGLTPARNHYAVEFFNQFGIDRYIFGRKTPVSDMEPIISRNRQIEFEAFFLNERCLYSEEYCNGVLCDRLCSTCTINYKTVWNDSQKFTQTKRMLKLQSKLLSYNSGNVENIRKNDNSLAVRGCGLCMYRKLEQAGVTHLKIVGRMLDYHKIIDDIKAAKEVSEINISDHAEYKQYVKDKFFGGRCPVSCYYLQT